MASNQQSQSAMPMSTMFEMQRNMIQQGQRAMQQGVDLQRSLTESWMRNGLDSGRSIQQQNTNFARNWMDATVRTWDAMLQQEGGEQSEIQQTLREQFEQFDEAQQEAWSAFQQSLDESMRAYDDLTQSQKELIDRSFNSFFEMQQRAQRQVADAAEEMERQTREAAQGGQSGQSSEE